MDDDSIIIDFPPTPKPKPELQRTQEQQPKAFDFANPDAHRDEHGRFLPGWKGGHSGGNPHSFHQKRNRMAILQAITPEIARQLTLQTLDIASDPKVRPADRLKATELLLRYAAGEPTQKHEVEVTQSVPTPGPIDLDTSDVAALERIRAKLTAPPEIVVDAPRNDATGTATE